MDKKFKIFLEIAKSLNNHGITPIIYGSLGVSRIISVSDIEDIDIVIPNIWLSKKFIEFKKIMENIDFKQDSQYPHEFNRNKTEEHIGFESREQLEKKMGVKPGYAKITGIDGIKFGELLAKDYLLIYSKTEKLWKKRIIKIQNKISKLKALLK